MHLNWLAKIELRGPGPPDRQIAVNYCFTRVLLLYTKMLKETETEETIGFFVTFFVIGGISIERRRAPWAPPDYTYGWR